MDNRYKWLAKQWEERGAFGFFERPEFRAKSWAFLAVDDQPNPQHISTPPSWLRAGQLWERMSKAVEGVEDGEGVRTDGSLTHSVWNGYWWRKVEDNGQKENDMEFKKGDTVEYVARGLSRPCTATVFKVDEANEDVYVDVPGVADPVRWEMGACQHCEPAKQPVDAGLYEAVVDLVDALATRIDIGDWNRFVEPVRTALTASPPVEPQGWITDRRPTEGDGDESGWVCIWTESDGCIFDDWSCAGDRPWQSIPQCLRTKPEQPKCEGCVHEYEFKGIDDKVEKMCSPEDNGTYFTKYAYGYDLCDYTPKD